jgi:hypothetical protein
MKDEIEVIMITVREYNELLEIKKLYDSKKLHDSKKMRFLSEKNAEEYIEDNNIKNVKVYQKYQYSEGAIYGIKEEE